MRSQRLHVSIAIAALLALAVGCASGQGPERSPDQTARRGLPEETEPRMHLELIEKMIEGGRVHAALAHLDALEAEAAREPAAQLLRAEALRRTGRRDEARKAYEALLETEAAAPAWRGLALIEVGEGELETAVEWLRKARDLQPTAARIRNDLGYALMLQGDFEESRHELVTALELDGEKRTARNLVVLLLLRNEPEAAQRIARTHEIDASGVAWLRKRADTLRTRIEQGDGA